MVTRFSLAGGLAVLALAAALVGCDPNKNNASDNGAVPTSQAPSQTTGAADAFNKPRKTSGLILIKSITNGDAPFWDTMGIGLAEGVKEISADPASGWTAPSQADNNSQKDTFEKAMAANPDGIGISVIDAQAFAPVIDAAIEKGVPVITFDSDAPNSKRLCYIGTNNFDAGVKAGEAAVKLFPNGAKMIAFVGNMSADNAKQRYEGFQSAVKGHNIEMLQAPYEDDKDANRARRNVADAITKYGDQINGLLALYSYDGPAVVDEVQKAGLIGKVKLVCFDGEERLLEDLKKGLVDVTVVQKPYEFGRLTAVLLNGINRKGLDAALKDMEPELTKAGMKLDMSKHTIDTGVQVVTPANSAQFLKDLNAKGLKST